MIVSNASTLILLAKISMLKKFLDKYGKVTIPEEVFKEVDTDSINAKILKKEVAENRIVVKERKSDIGVILKEFRLDKGEASAYALYNEYRGRLILTDDGELIKLCKLFDVPYANALAVVTRMFKDGTLKLDEACRYLEKLYDYGRYSEEVYDFFRKEVGC